MDMQRCLEAIYEDMHDPQIMETVMEYDARHGIDSAAILTVTDDERAALIASHLEERLRGKMVVELGGGIGLLALHLSDIADRIYVIEANPLWTSVFTAYLYQKKPRNVTWIFGAAEEMKGQLHADVALFCTHSDHDGMTRTASMFAPVVIDVYKDILGAKHWSMRN